MKIIPVIDLMGGVVVRGVAGQRSEYRPVESCLVDGAEPLQVAGAFREQFQFDEIYLADLDAIAGHPPAFGLYGQLRELGFRIWVDAGVREARDAAALYDAGVDTILLGLETLAGPEVAEQLCREQDPSRLVFSLDLKDGQPLCGESWGSINPVEIAERMSHFGIRRVLVLDLASVGVSRGTCTEELCSQLLDMGLEVTAGGGVRGKEDLQTLYGIGIENVLVASALHNGNLTPAMIRQL